MPYKVKVDRILCIGAAACVAVAPKTFVLDYEGKSTIKNKNTGIASSDFTNFNDIDDTQENILNGAKSCPTNAIIIVEVDNQGKEIRQIWP